jgi:hypothetical protein
VTPGTLEAILSLDVAWRPGEREALRDLAAAGDAGRFELHLPPRLAAELFRTPPTSEQEIVETWLERGDRWWWP